jgi:hypothetical protein
MDFKVGQRGSGANDREKEKACNRPSEQVDYAAANDEADIHKPMPNDGVTNKSY